MIVELYQLRERLERGDFAGALSLSENLLSLVPGADTRLIAAALSLATGQPGRGLEILADDTASSAMAVRGKCLVAMGEYAAARDLCRKALAVDPSNEDLRCVLLDATSRLNASGGEVNQFEILSLMRFSQDEYFAIRKTFNGLLRHGRLQEGYAAISAQAESWPASRMGAPAIEIFGGHLPRWDGGNVGRLLVVANEGNGDILQFVRFCAQARQRADHITLCAPSSLTALLARCDGVDAVVSHDEIYSAAQCADAYIPTMFHLPHALGAEYGPGCYLTADADRIPLLRGGRHVGLCWTCSGMGAEVRGIPESHMVSLRGMDGITFHSLVPGAGPSWMSRHDLPDYDATAALVAALDLVITCDTSVAHLAGGMGKAVWVLLPADADWRWGTDEIHSHWYPSARLFRQSIPGNWGEVIECVFCELSKGT